MEFLSSHKPVAYEEAVRLMEERVAQIHAGQGLEAVWFLEHPPLYTAGTSAKGEDLLNAEFPVYESGRGGQYTYHGPGQLVGYVMIALNRHHEKPDIRRYVWQLEEWIIRSLARFDVQGERREGRVGIWVDMAAHCGLPGQEAKIAALGVRVRHGITFHGVSINRAPDLSHFDGIVPCGISAHGVTSLEALGMQVSRAELEAALKAEWPALFSVLR